MKQDEQSRDMDEVWIQMCQAGDIDPQQRLAARLAILDSAEAEDCTVYRPDEDDPDAEEEDLGDARILFTGPFQAPEDWDEEERAEFFGDEDPALFQTAFIECVAKPASRQFFVPDVGDYVAIMSTEGVAMFYVHDYFEDENGRKCVLIRDEIELD